ncbi:MAG: glycosyltransferase family 4 protein [Acidobacteriota bacterium]
MRIVLVGPAHPFRGGIAQHTACLYRALQARHEVLLISFSRQYPGIFFPGRSQHDESGYVLRVPNLPLLDSLDPRSWRRTGTTVRQWKPDVLVFQWWQPFFGPAYRTVARKVRGSGCRILFVCHNVFAHREFSVVGSRLVEKRLARAAFRYGDGFLVQAQTLARALRELGIRAPIEMVSHPLYDFFQEWDEPGEPADRSERAVPTLLFFGNIRPYKGLDIFLRALARLKDAMPFRAIVAGDFYMDPRPYRRLTEELGLQDHVVWRDGYVPNEEVPRLFRSADLVVLPYIEATQSGVVPVAYLFDVPVIASDVGGLSEVVFEGRTGLLVPPGDPVRLAERILEYFRENRRERFRENIQAVRRELTWDRVVEALERLALHAGGGGA